MSTLNPVERRTVRLDRLRQWIDGFGVCEAFHQAGNIRVLSEPVRAEVLDVLFAPGRGSGFSIIRNIIGDGGTWGNHLDGPTPTIEPAEGQWSWTGDEDQIWITREAFARGCQKVLASAWSPPAWMKTNGSVVGGSLRKDKYRAYAKYLSRYVREYRARHGIEIHAVSPSNEPDLSTSYSSCLWTANQLTEFIAEHLGPVFERDRVSAKIVVPETEHFGSARSAWYAGALARPDAALRIGVVAQHGYGGKIEVLEEARNAGKPVWLTEISDARKDGNDTSMSDGIRWARTVHDYLTLAEVSAWCYFWGASTYYKGPISLLGIVEGQGTVVRNKRLFAIGNFARVVRPGFRRVEVAPEERDGVSVSAFTRGDAEDIAVVAINENSSPRMLALEMPAAVPRTFRCYRTSVDEDLSRCADVRQTEDTLTIVLPGVSVTSLAGPTQRSEPPRARRGAGGD
jgi:glucuronoarabinoxylan endo-1,4-beta-xylanase